MRPETHYVDTPGGQIAYQVVGDGPRDVVYVNGVTSQPDMRWELPQFRRFLERLASFSRLILFDRRGSGLSDPVPGDVVIPTWEEWAEDLVAVLDEVDSSSAAVIATVDAGPMAMIFAATHPERTTALVLANTSARIGYDEDYPAGFLPADLDELRDLIRRTWGRPENGAIVNPSIGDDEQTLEWFARYMRASCTPARAAAQMYAEFTADVRSILPLIRCPTLVMQARSSVMPLAHGEYLAEHISGARLVQLDTADGGLMFDRADENLALIEEFLTGESRSDEGSRFLATVAFTDLVDSTRRAAELGDRRWHGLMERHDALLREAVEHFGGRVWKSTGDGAMATFDAPGRAVRALLRFHRSLAGLGVSARAGVHAGEVEQRVGDIGGIAVNIAARVMAEAGASEVLVSRTVVDLVAGSELEFVDVGARVLKGVPGEWHLFAAKG